MLSQEKKGEQALYNNNANVDNLYDCFDLITKDTHFPLFGKKQKTAIYFQSLKIQVDSDSGTFLFLEKSSMHN